MCGNANEKYIEKAQAGHGRPVLLSVFAVCVFSFITPAGELGSFAFCLIFQAKTSDNQVPVHPLIFKLSE